MKAAFPELRQSINEQYGLIHLEMHVFLDFVKDQIDSANRDKVSRAFQIVERHFMNGNSDLVSAIGVSFLEHLDLGLAKEKPSWALEIFPSSLRQAYEEIRKYHGL